MSSLIWLSLTFMAAFVSLIVVFHNLSPNIPMKPTSFGLAVLSFILTVLVSPVVFLAQFLATRARRRAE